MINLIAHQGKFAYGVKVFVVDTTNEKDNLPTDCEMGSMAYVIEDSTSYCLNSNKEWKQVNFSIFSLGVITNEESQITQLN